MRLERSAMARAGSSGQRELRLIRNRTCTSLTANGAWCRCSTSKGNCCITLAGREPGRSSFSCRRACRLTSRIAFTWWMHLTGECRYFITTVSRRRRTGGNNREAAADARGPRVFGAEFCAEHADRRRAGHAQFVAAERCVGVFAGQPGLHVLPCSTQRIGRQHSAVEPETVDEVLRAV